MTAMPPDALQARVDAIAAAARASDPRKVVMEQCPSLVAWLREWQDVTGTKAKLLWASVDGREVYRDA